MKRIYHLTTWALLFIMLFITSGCATRPFLTSDNSYYIQVLDSDGTIHETPIELSWNSNAKVMQKLLLEASFVMSDLKSEIEDESSLEDTNDIIVDGDQNDDGENNETIILKAVFPEAKQFNLVIDNKPLLMDIESVQIQVKGQNPGRVVLNQTLIFQGIPNPNLEPAYDEFVKMIEKHSLLDNVLDEKLDGKAKVDEEEIPVENLKYPSEAERLSINANDDN